MGPACRVIEDPHDPHDDEAPAGLGEPLQRNHAGKTAALWRACQEHGEAIEADLARYYGIRLGKLGTRELTWRRLWNLVSQLPLDSAYGRAVAGDDPVWLPGDYLLAEIRDALWLGIWQRGGNPRARKPTPMRRPGQPAVAAPRARSVDEVRALLNEHQRQGTKKTRKRRKGGTDGH